MTTQRNSIRIDDATREQVKAAIIALFHAKGRPAAVKALALFKVQNLTEVSPSQYGPLVAVCVTKMNA